MKTKEPAETKTKKMKKAGNNRWWKYLIYMQRRRPTKKWQGFRRWGQSCGCENKRTSRNKNKKDEKSGK